jgi:hypothetical protein
MQREDFRRRVIAECGAIGDPAEQLLLYNQNPFATFDGRAPAFPLADEPHIEHWVSYENDARSEGAFEALRRRFVQLRFPVRAGMSAEEAYRSATRRGRFADADAFAPGLVLRRPSGLELSVCPTMAGRIPVLVVEERADFVSLVQAFTDRNEPVPVPDSMGACIVTGLNNWNRIASYRRSWEQSQSRTAPAAEEDWNREFRQLLARKELYQDRFIILSRGPYSATPAIEVGLGEDEWRGRSLIIRREHEFTHYFTWRVFGAMRNNALDELIADMVGIVRAFGCYRKEIALRFLGLEGFPRYREGGRLESYRGSPPLCDEAFAALGCLAVRAADNLASFAAEHASLLDNLPGLGAVTFALARLTLEELASGEMRQLAARQLEASA